ncbi:MAG: Mov34/MPN/PAD-1 family protein [SAR324 cluster bacterium]
MNELTIPEDLLQRCFALGVQGYPEEVCGVLAGPESDPKRLTAAHPVRNILNRLHAEDPERYPRTAAEGYVLDPKEHMLLERKLTQEGQTIRVIFHSHVEVGAYFSEEDKRRALWDGEPLFPGVAYLVCGIKERRPDGAILARFDPGRRDFTETRILAPGSGTAAH